MIGLVMAGRDVVLKFEDVANPKNIIEGHPMCYIPTVLVG